MDSEKKKTLDPKFPTRGQWNKILLKTVQTNMRFIGSRDYRNIHPIDKNLSWFYFISMETTEQGIMIQKKRIIKYNRVEIKKDILNFMEETCSIPDVDEIKKLYSEKINDASWYYE